MGVSGQVRRNMNYYAYDIARLPDPNPGDNSNGDDGTFRLSDVDIDMSRLHQLWAEDVVEKRSDDYNRVPHRWAVDSTAYAEAQQYLAQTDQKTLPCGHTSVYNVPDGEFECGECGWAISREEAEAVLG